MPTARSWRRARRKQELPSPALIAEMKARVGYKNMRLDEARRTGPVDGREPDGLGPDDGWRWGATATSLPMLTGCRGPAAGG